MSNLNHFMNGFTRSLERRNKQQSKQISQTAQNVDADEAADKVITTDKAIDSDAINTNTTELTNKQYQATIVQKMTALIHKRKMK